jgi:hypothetical protein
MITAGEMVGKAFGFQPVSSTKSYEAYAAQKHREQVRSDKIDELTVLALKAHDTGKSGAYSGMLKELRAWNDKMRAEGKPMMIIKLQDVQRRVLARRRQNRATPKQQEKGAYQSAVWGI